MSTIIAGKFQLQDQAASAIAALQDAGFTRARISSFFVNPPGQHDLYLVGGDADDSPGAHEAPSGAIRGAEIGVAVGAVAGVMAAPFLAPAAAALGAGIGAGVGAYTGSLAGALGSLGEPVQPEHDHNAEESGRERHPLRRAGMLVGVAVAGAAERADAVRVLRAQGATDVEWAEGRIDDAQWTDFDPLAPVQLVVGEVPTETDLPVS
jgi:hypothetical protein